MRRYAFLLLAGAWMAMPWMAEPARAQYGDDQLSPGVLDAMGINASPVDQSRFNKPPGVQWPVPTGVVNGYPKVLRAHWFKEYRWYRQQPDYSNPAYLAGYNDRYPNGVYAQSLWFVQPRD